MHERNYVKTLSVISAILIGGILIIILYNSKRRKQINARFEEIIKNIEQQNLQFNQVSNMSEISVSSDSENKTSDKKQKLISDNKEAELLEKLAAFEAGKEFTSSNFNKSNLAAILNTNIKYLNIILKEHRGKSFNNYINGLRIDFVVKLLYNEPDHLNYKINYLSELAGFSSHSYFTQIFKKELNIAPAEFISRLSKSKNY